MKSADLVFSQESLPGGQYVVVSSLEIDGVPHFSKVLKSLNFTCL